MNKEGIKLAIFPQRQETLRSGTLYQVTIIYQEENNYLLVL